MEKYEALKLAELPAPNPSGNVNASASPQDAVIREILRAWKQVPGPEVVGDALTELFNGEVKEALLDLRRGKSRSFARFMASVECVQKKMDAMRRRQ
jgi:hypothetical protein